jgi:predicted outer membrane repeat protein
MKCRRCIIFASWLALAVFSPIYAREAHAFALRDGDIVFTGSKAGQGAAISAATGSPITHCGVVFRKEGKLMEVPKKAK